MCRLILTRLRNHFVLALPTRHDGNALIVSITCLNLLLLFINPPLLSAHTHTHTHTQRTRTHTHTHTHTHAHRSKLDGPEAQLDSSPLVSSSDSESSSSSSSSEEGGEPMDYDQVCILQ